MTSSAGPPASSLPARPLKDLRADERRLASAAREVRLPPVAVLTSFPLRLTCSCFTSRSLIPTRRILRSLRSSSCERSSSVSCSTSSDCDMITLNVSFVAPPRLSLVAPPVSSWAALQTPEVEVHTRWRET